MLPSEFLTRRSINFESFFILYIYDTCSKNIGDKAGKILRGRTKRLFSRQLEKIRKVKIDSSKAGQIGCSRVNILGILVASSHYV